MPVSESTAKTATLSARNIGGIDRTQVEFTPGVTILAGRNATNRTSLLQAVMAALGSDNVSVKGDAAEAEVELTLGDESFTRTLTRANGTISTSGDPYLDDPEIADLFAFLLEANEARRAVARGDNLRELIMRPVDTTAIQAEITRLEEEKSQIDDELDELADAQHRLPDLENRRSQLQEQIDDKRAELDALEAEIADADAELTATRESQAAVEDRLNDLGDRRSDLEDVRYALKTERASLEALQAERADIESELADLPDDAGRDRAMIEDELADLREKRQRVQSKLSELRTVIQFNEELLDGDKPHIRSALRAASDAEGDSVTDDLIAGSITCWTCGSTVDQSAVDRTLDLLREVRSETLAEQDDLEARIDDLEEEKSAIAERQQRRAELRERREEIDEELDETEQTIESLQEQKTEIENEIETLEAEVESEANRSDVHEKLLERHEAANELEFELGRLRNELDSVETEIEELESQLEDKAELEERRETIREELTELRTRIDRVQEDAVNTFNEHMDVLLDQLDYDNLDRVWIERTETEIRDGRGTATRPTFNLHVIRNPADDAAYEDTIDHLSESEREVVGLVFALAGYLVHEVYEECPFILLDSLEALDSERIATLVEYVNEFSEYLVVALLPEDAQALDDDYPRVTEI